VRVGSTLEDVSRRLIEATLAECGSKRKAADMLGISLKTLYNRLAAYKEEGGAKRRGTEGGVGRGEESAEEFEERNAA